MREEIRAIVQQHGRLAVDVGTLSDDADLYDAGLSSHASINLMLALENAFDLEFPERLLRRRTFESISAMQAAIEELTGARPASASPRSEP
jgi:acyl carrier protein